MLLVGDMRSHVFKLAHNDPYFFWLCLLNIIFIRYRVIEVLAGGGSALVEWRLETGRTHQVR